MNNAFLILAQADKPGGGLFGSPIIMMVLMVVIFWVVLISGKTVSLRLSEGIFVKYDKSAIATVVTGKEDETVKK